MSATTRYFDVFERLKLKHADIDGVNTVYTFTPERPLKVSDLVAVGHQPVSIVANVNTSSILTSTMTIETLVWMFHEAKPRHDADYGSQNIKELSELIDKFLLHYKNHPQLGYTNVRGLPFVGGDIRINAEIGWLPAPQPNNVGDQTAKIAAFYGFRLQLQIPVIIRG